MLATGRASWRMVHGEEEGDVKEFPYLGATVDKEGGGLHKACRAARGIGRRTKIWVCLFKT